jgi:hypothetical protein
MAYFSGKKPETRCLQSISKKSRFNISCSIVRFPLFKPNIPLFSPRRRLRRYEPEAIIFTAPAQLNPILLLFNRGETLFSFHWCHTAHQENGRKKYCDANKL